MLSIIIATCPRCGISTHGFTKEEAIESLNDHICLEDLSDKELSQLLKEIIMKEITNGTRMSKPNTS